MGNFEDILRKKLEGHEVPYDAAQWDKLESRLNGKPTGGGKNWMYGGIAAAVVIAGTFIIMNSGSDNAQTAENKTNTHTENTITANKNSNSNTEEANNHGNNSAVEENTNNHSVNGNENANANVNHEEEVVNNSNSSNENNNSTTNSNTTNPNSNKNNSTTTVQNNTSNQNTNNSTTVNPNSVVNNTVILTPSFTVSRTTICAGESVICRAENANADCDLVWEFGDGKFSKEAKHEHTYKTEGEYVVSLRYHDKKNNKLVSKEVSQIVKVNPTPKADFSWETTEGNGVPAISFINLTDNAEKWNWNFGDGKTSTEKQPEHTFVNKGSYGVTLEATNEFGCKNTKPHTVVVEEDFNLFAPNSFTPDGNGINDDFIPKALSVMDVNFTMTIYDKSGQRVFQTSRVDSPWDGRNSVTGGTSPTGAYVWIVTISNPKPGQPDSYKGTVTLLR